MRATLNIPDELISEVQNITGAQSKTKAIVAAMEEFIRQKRVYELLQLQGQIEIAYDWIKEEELEMQLQKQREEMIERNK